MQEPPYVFQSRKTYGKFGSVKRRNQSHFLAKKRNNKKGKGTKSTNCSAAATAAVDFNVDRNNLFYEERPRKKLINIYNQETTIYTPQLKYAVDQPQPQPQGLTDYRY